MVHKFVIFRRMHNQAWIFFQARNNMVADADSCRTFLSTTDLIENQKRHVFLANFDEYMENIDASKAQIKKIKGVEWGKNANGTPTTMDVGRLRALFSTRKDKQFDRFLNELFFERYLRGLLLPPGAPKPFYSLAVDAKTGSAKAKAAALVPRRKEPKQRTEDGEQWRHRILLDIDCKSVYSCTAKTCSCNEVMVRSSLYLSVSGDRRAELLSGALSENCYEAQVAGAAGSAYVVGGSSAAASGGRGNTGNHSTGAPTNVIHGRSQPLKKSQIKFVREADFPLQNATICFTCPSSSRDILDGQRQGHVYGVKMIQSSGPNGNTVYLVCGDTLDDGHLIGKSYTFGTKYKKAMELQAGGTKNYLVDVEGGGVGGVGSLVT